MFKIFTKSIPHCSFDLPDNTRDNIYVYLYKNEMTDIGKNKYNTFSTNIEQDISSSLKFKIFKTKVMEINQMHQDHIVQKESSDNSNKKMKLESKSLNKHFHENSKQTTMMQDENLLAS